MSSAYALCYVVHNPITAYGSEIPEDGEADVDTYNKGLSDLEEKKLNTWFKAPWLYAE